MKFCDACGTRLTAAGGGLVCRRCGTKVRAQRRRRREALSVEREVEGGIYFVGKREEELAKTSKVCPTCGSGEAYYWVSNVGGEHAGIQRERMIEHFRCLACATTWSESS